MLNMEAVKDSGFGSAWEVHWYMYMRAWDWTSY